jgi:tRNA(adenine34) deaminase
MNVEEDDIKWMSAALKEAERAGEEDEVPVGAVFVFEGRIIARARNQCELLKDPTAHAEMVGITQACAALSSQRLVGVEAYVTKEPCVMCAGALVHARVSRLVIGAKDEKAGACGTVLQVVANSRLNHQVSLRWGVLGDPCRALLQSFFRAKRKGADRDANRGG